MRKRSTARRRRLFRHCLTLAVAACPPGVALADGEDTLNVVAGATLRYDHNLFRLPDDVSPTAIGAGEQRSDTILSTYVGLRLDKPVSLQRFQVDATLTEHRYRNYEQFDFSGREYQARWLWAVTPRLTGTLAAGRSERRVDFADFRDLSGENRQINETRQASADWRVTGGWHVIGGVSSIESRNAAAFTAVGSFTQDAGEAGLRYASTADNSLAFVRREARGEFKGRELDFRQLDTGYDQTENEVRIAWRAGGKSLLDARLAHLERRHDHFPARDYSGAVGRVLYHWFATAKLQLRLEAARDLVSFQELSNSYYVAHTFSVEPIWLMTTKTSARLRFFSSERDYRAPLPLFAGLQPAREDTFRGAQAFLDWQPRRFLAFSANVGREERESNLAGLDYDAYTAGVTVELRF